jgi:hypothetical protein
MLVGVGGTTARMNPETSSAMNLNALVGMIALQMLTITILGNI